MSFRARAEEMDELVRSLRRGPLCPATKGAVSVAYGREALRRLLPHREPFLLLDGITTIDLGGASIAGRLDVAADDPVFAGHFPGDPVYPGVLLIEAVGQLGLCLWRFLSAHSTDVPAQAPPRLRVAWVHHAAFFQPVLPGDPLTLHARLVDSNDLTGVVAGQVCKGAALCSTTILEVYVD